MIYTEADKPSYQPPACPTCGSADHVHVEWVQVATDMDPDIDQWMPGPHVCRNPDCPDGGVSTGRLGEVFQ